MSEKAPKSPEITPNPESYNKEALENYSSIEKKSTKSHESEKISKDIEKARDRLNNIDLEESRPQSPLETTETIKSDVSWTSRELLDQNYQRTLTSVRNRLPKSQKTLSKVVHQPVIEKSSELMENTIARPSGILFGSIFSLVGSLAAYILAKRLGGEMPSSVFGILFVGGFVIGLIVELTWRYLKSKK